MISKRKRASTKAAEIKCHLNRIKLVFNLVISCYFLSIEVRIESICFYDTVSLRGVIPVPIGNARLAFCKIDKISTRVPGRFSPFCGGFCAPGVFSSFSSYFHEYAKDPFHQTKTPARYLPASRIAE